MSTDHHACKLQIKLTYVFVNVCTPTSVKSINISDGTNDVHTQVTIIRMRLSNQSDISKPLFV